MTASGEENTRVARVVVADDLESMRTGLRLILSPRDDVEIVGEAADGSEAVHICRVQRPDLVLMDIEMPGMDGIQATRKIKEEMPATSVLVLTAHDDPEYLLDAIAAGAAGYLLKGEALFGVDSAIQAVLGGEPVLEPKLAMSLLQRMSGPDKEEAEREPRREELLSLLTSRELEILAMISRGQTNAQIAECLFLSVGTVKTHVHRVISTLGVSDRTQAAVLAIRLGLTG
jgi:DNA-binding NarL/FixJ family response regulator